MDRHRGSATQAPVFGAAACSEEPQAVTVQYGDHLPQGAVAMATVLALRAKVHGIQGPDMAVQHNRRYARPQSSRQFATCRGEVSTY